MEKQAVNFRRQGVYLATAVTLIILFIASRDMQWSGSTQLHTLMEVVATLLALMTGCLSLMRFYSKQDKTFLLVGAAFIGTAFLDGYHALISADFFGQYMPSAGLSVIPWSWLASRIFISVLLFLSWLTWHIHRERADSIWERARFIYGITAVFTIACFLFFVMTPLPSGYGGFGPIHRPGEYLAAFFLFATLIGYLRKGAWQFDPFEHCLIIALILNLAAQACFMPTSSGLYDLDFDVAHILKIASYIAVLVGLLINMYRIFQDESLLRQKLGESEEKHRTISESSHDAIVRYDREHRFTYLNTAAALAYGCDADSFIGMKPRNLSLSPDLCGTWESAIDAVFASGKPCSLNYEVNTLDGLVTVDWKAYPEFDSQGKVESVISVSRDISQFRQSKEETSRIHKLESIGLMAGGIAHDFNNILLGLFGNIFLAKSALPENHESHQHLERAEQAFKRATNLTKQFLTFSQGGNPVKTLVALQRIVEEVVQFNLAGTQTTSVLRFADDTWPVLADEGQLVQVFANLVINASQSMDGGGSITITMENAVVGQAEDHPDDPLQFVRIVVRDNGGGIAAEHLDKIFDPYFSTKNAGRGLGLTTVYSIIRQHGGNIYVKSVPGTGTSFTLLLPAEAGATNPERTATTTAPASRHATVLVMDDDRLVLEVSSAILRKLGHVVEVARDGGEAIEKYQHALKSGKPYDCLIMDLTVPGGMGGMEAMAKILEINPRAKALVCSGYATDPVMANCRAYGFISALPKPFTMSSLKEALAEVLNS
ncbi:MAG: ATP-binding protein [Pseudomonadota bacterium]